MSFGLCNAPATFQRCMLGIFSDMVECFLEIFMDDFSVFGDSFDDYLTRKGFEHVWREESCAELEKISFYGNK